MKYLRIFLILLGFLVSPSVLSDTFSDSDPNNDYLKFTYVSIEKINDTFYYVSDPFKLNSQSTDISFHDVLFTTPYTTIPPRYIYSDVLFSDKTKESLGVVIISEPDFTEHVKPQAGLIQRNDGYHFLVSVNLKEMYPLKQIQNGIPFTEIQCKEGLILIQKYDGSPACVTEQTKQKLIERGWVKNECARLFDSSMDKYSNHAKEQREKGVVWLPPTLEGLVLNSDYFEEWRNYGCIETINDWKHLSENTRSLNELNLNKLK